MSVLVSDYTSLASAVQSFVHRNDSDFVNNGIPLFISLAELRINRRVRLRVEEKLTTGITPTSTDTGNVLMLPVDMGQIEELQVIIGSEVRDLRYIAPANMANYSTTTGSPTTYTTINQQCYIFPPPDAAYTYNLFYVAQLVPISPANPTNVLVNGSLNSGGDVYLFASLLAAALWVKTDPDTVAGWKEAFEISLNELKSHDQKMQYSQGILRITTNDTVKP
jgi:hypothetical protein